MNLLYGRYIVFCCWRDYPSWTAWIFSTNVHNIFFEWIFFVKKEKRFEALDHLVLCSKSTQRRSSEFIKNEVLVSGCIQIVNCTEAKSLCRWRKRDSETKKGMKFSKREFRKETELKFFLVTSFKNLENSNAIILELITEKLIDIFIT